MFFSSEDRWPGKMRGLEKSIPLPR